MTSKLPYLGKVSQRTYLNTSTRNCKPHPRMSHRSDKGWTDIHLFLFIRRSTDCDYDDFKTIDLIRITYLGTDIIS